MNQSQRRRAQRLRAKADKAARGESPELNASEVRWLAWYEDNKGPSPIRPTPEPEDEPEDDPEDEPESAPTVALRVATPEPPPPRYDVSGQAVEREPSSPGVVERLTPEDCTHEGMRSALNVQIAAGQQMEIACSLAFELVREMKSERAGLTQLMSDTLTALVESQFARGAERIQSAQQASTPASEAAQVTDEVAKRMIDRVFPAKPDVTTQEPTE